MSTLMEAKIKEAFEEWKKADEELKQTTEESNMEKSKSKSGTLSQQLLAYIIAHPGVTGTQLRRVVKERAPSTPISYVPAVLKGLFDAHYVRREEKPNENGQLGRSTYAYYALTEAERDAARNRPKIKAQPKYTKKKKTAVEVVDRPVKGITSLVPAKRHAMHALEVGPATVAISIAMQNGSTYSMNVNDARFVYAQLNQIFGGVR